MINDLFRHHDFYKFLQDDLVNNSKSRRGEKGKLAQHLGVQPSLLSQYLSGSRHLNEDQVYLIGEFYGLSELEQEYLSLLFRLSNATTSSLRSRLKKKIESIKSESKKISSRVSVDKVMSEAEKAIMYSSWLYIAIWAYASLDNGKTLEEIASKFDLGLKKSKEIVDFLVRSQLCILKDGRYVHHINRTHIEKDSPYFKQHHNNWRIKSIQSLDQLNESDITFTAPLTLSKQDFVELRQSILTFIDGVYKRVKETEPEDMYCLNIDFFSF